MMGGITATVFTNLVRQEACEKWAAWWNKYLDDYYTGDHSKCAQKIWGVNDKGVARSASQVRKWRLVENNCLPSTNLLVDILADAKVMTGKTVKPEAVINHGIEYVAPNLPKHRKSKIKRKAKTMADQPLFHIDENIPAPDMSFASSDEFEGYYVFELTATLPMAGVLALMAMLDDAT